MTQVRDQRDGGSAATGRTIAEIVELVGGLAHELRNPLSILMVNLKLLAEDLEEPSSNLDDVRRRSLLKLAVLQREADRLQQLFDEFLRLAGPCNLRRTEVDLNALLARLAEFLEPSMVSYGVRMTVAAAENGLRCDVDEGLLSQALLNIAINAQEAMPHGGNLEVRLARRKGGVLITMGDTGVGIPRSDSERIFRPFFSTKAGGTGLGLAITKRIIEEHGGTLTFQSEPGRGTTFEIHLPENSALKETVATP